MDTTFCWLIMGESYVGASFSEKSLQIVRTPLIARAYRPGCWQYPLYSAWLSPFKSLRLVVMFLDF